jgi:hypothetical protein
MIMFARPDVCTPATCARFAMFINFVALERKWREQ